MLEPLSGRAFIFFVTSIKQDEIPGFEPDLTEEGLLMRKERRENLTVQQSSYIIMQHYMLLSRNLLYKVLSRAKQLAILVGPTKAIGLAVKRIRDRERYTALADRLKHLATRSVL